MATRDELYGLDARTDPDGWRERCLGSAYSVVLERPEYRVRALPRGGKRATGGATTRTSTLAGRDGAASERKSRSGARWLQKGQVRRSVGEAGPASETGASQRAHASVPLPSRPDRVLRRSSSCAATARVIGSQRSESESPIPR